MSPENVIPTKEEQIHPLTTCLRAWAESVARGTGIETNRARVLDVFRELPVDIENLDTIKAYYRLAGYVRSQGLDAALPMLHSAVQQLPETPNTRQVELLGFTYLMALGAEQSTTIEQMGIKVDLQTFGARLGHAEDFNHEDWLTSLSMITWYKNTQQEMQAKSKVMDQNVHDLVTLNPPAITLDHTASMYDNVVRAIYPNSHNFQTFREQKTMFDGLISIISDLRLRLFAINYSAEGRRAAFEQYLDEYNAALTKPIGNPSRNLAKLFTTYLVIHPHQDGNGTMTRTFMNYYSVRRDLPIINWDFVKTDQTTQKSLQDAFEKYVYDGTKLPLEDWFDGQVFSQR
jgi:hypothetical protein